MEEDVYPDPFSVIFTSVVPFLSPTTATFMTGPPVAPSPTAAPTCSTFEGQLDACLIAAGATDEQKVACENCISTISKLAGAIDDNTSATCEEVNGLACTGLDTNCDCLTCQGEKIALGQCSIDEERAENGETQCGPVMCGPAAPTDVPAPTSAPGPGSGPAPGPSPSSAYATSSNMKKSLIIATAAAIMIQIASTGVIVD